MVTSTYDIAQKVMCIATKARVPPITHTIYGTGIFTDPWMVDFYGKLVGKYTNPMDATMDMGYNKLWVHAFISS